MAWLSAEKIDALSGRQHFRVCVRGRCNKIIKSKKESKGIDYFIILSDGKSFHVSNTLRFKVLQDVLLCFCYQNWISNDSF